MARTRERLKPLAVARITRPGMYPDGGNLYLQVTSPDAKSWIFRYAVNGRERYLGLGPAHKGDVSLDDARKEASKCRELLRAGIDPIEHRKAARMQAQLQAAKAMTFDDCAAAYIASHESGWRNAKHRSQWQTTLRDYASPVFGKLAVQAIDTGLVMRVIEPLWKRRPETASRLRGRIESVLDWATVRGYRSGENPARWKGHLDHLLPARSRVRSVKRLAALPYAEINAFMALLRAQEGTVARALEFAILTVARTGETIGAKWSEVNLQDKTWTIPGERMKSGKEHRVPLSPHALAIFKEMQGLDDELVFPGIREGGMMDLVRRIMKRSDITVHGFRSTFRDWAAEHTNYQNHVVEMALAHAIPCAVEASYRRGDLFEKRRKLMEAWARYCDTPAGKVVPLRAETR
jgi:integrase